MYVCASSTSTRTPVALGGGALQAARQDKAAGDHEDTDELIDDLPEAEGGREGRTDR
jgi:hypothetical protein